MHTVKLRKFIGIFLALAAMICVVIQPMEALKSSAAENYRLWRQSDPRWSDIQIGSAGATIRSEGCLVTAIAILAVHSGAENPDKFNPGTFAEALKKLDGFSAYGAISSWSKITDVIPKVKLESKYTFKSSSRAGKAKEMKALADGGYYLVCNVGNHWVFVDSIVGSDVYMIDPAKDDIKLFEAYQNSTVTELRVFTSAKKPVNTTGKTTAETTAAATEASYKTGEYYNLNSGYVKIYASSESNSAILENLEPRQLVKVDKVKDGWGCIQLGMEKGWVDLAQLTYAAEDKKHSCGDINNDGVINKTDLALLNEYLLSITELPDGISVLRECEASAADINGDGLVDNNDVLKYLALICE